MSTKDDVFNYVMNSPEDTNPAVLRSLLNGIEEGGSGGVEYFDITYTCEEGGEPSIDKTYTQILSAYNSGKVVRLIIPAGNQVDTDVIYYTLKMTLCGLSMYDNDENYVEFSFFCVGNGLLGDNTYSVTALVDKWGNVGFDIEQIG